MGWLAGWLAGWTVVSSLHDDSAGIREVGGAKRRLAGPHRLNGHRFCAIRAQNPCEEAGKGTPKRNMPRYTHTISSRPIPSHPISSYHIASHRIASRRLFILFYFISFPSTSLPFFVSFFPPSTRTDFSPSPQSDICRHGGSRNHNHNITHSLWWALTFVRETRHFVLPSLTVSPPVSSSRPLHPVLLYYGVVWCSVFCCGVCFVFKELARRLSQLVGFAPEACSRLAGAMLPRYSGIKAVRVRNA
ncbi:hypothetical protein F5X97DRAFT_132241 [Nemania serpens]|nr:hypothetical protein F5X97DRAFT_132241 [Nemania serpens]